jgi:cephalosporin hydroxylase
MEVADAHPSNPKPTEQKVRACDQSEQQLDDIAVAYPLESSVSLDGNNAFSQATSTTVREQFFHELIDKTANFGEIKWLGHPIWQNILDLWTIQETIAEVRPHLLIECGTNRGGSSLFFAHLFDLMGAGEVVTVDIERLHSLSHPRVSYLIGDSTSAEILDEVQRRAAATIGPVMVILDSDHTREHVRRELDCYAPLVTPGSYCLVQDGVIDTLPVFSAARPGPLTAIEEFLAISDAFELDAERSERFLVTHHPKGWLRRKSAA